MSLATALPILDQIARAAIDPALWPDLLQQIATATGSTSGQLVGRRGTQLLFNLIADPEPDWLQAAARLGAFEPAINPRIHIGFGLPLLTPFTDDDLVDSRQRRLLPFYTRIAAINDRPGVCGAKVLDEGGVTVAFAVMRRKSQGEITPEQRALFSLFAAHIRAAVIIQQRLAEQLPRFTANLLESANNVAFICDGDGRILSLTPQAEQLLARGSPLVRRAGLLKATAPAERQQLAQSLGRAAHCMGAGLPPLHETLILGRDAVPPLLLEVISLPGHSHGLSFRPLVLLLASGTSQRRDVPALLRQLFTLTAAEAEVGAALLAGQTPEAIADARNTSLATVRVQIRAIHEKTGVRRSSELARTLASLY